MNFTEALAQYNSLHLQEPVEMRENGVSLLELALSGELDMKAASDLTPLLEAAVLECPPNGRLVLDLSRVSYISSTGVGLLSTILVKAERRAVSLVLLDIPLKVRNIMDSLGLLSFFTEGKRSCE
jgi:anti-sigma B factor antagonist